MSHGSPLVSVVIPTYNCERFIAETIDGVLRQTLKDIELIVVDDGSTDGTTDIVRSHSPQARLIEQRNSGVCAARNRGIGEATGKYICLIDHDDYWLSHKLALQARALEQHPEYGVVYSAFTLWSPDGEGRYPGVDSFESAPCTDEMDPDFSGWIYHLFLKDCWMLTSTAMFRREVFERCGTFDESLPYSEDWDLWLRLSRAYQFLKLRCSTTLYRQHPSQGNRVLRNVDYRTQLLTKAVEQWGLCSQDGRCLTKSQFNKQLSRYHHDFARGHQMHGDRRLARQSFIKSWLCNPYSVKALAHILAAQFGWKGGR